MSDFVQIGIVTTAAAAAALVFVRSTWPRRQSTTGEAPCPKCASGDSCASTPEVSTPQQRA